MSTGTLTQDPVSSIQLDPHEIEFYQREGFISLPGLLSPEVAGRMREEVLDVMDALGVTRASLSKASSTAEKLRQSGAYLAGSTMDQVVNSESLLSIAGQLLGGLAHLYMPFTAVKAGGGGGAFHFHQDNQYTKYDNGLHGINIWFALVDMTPENGCLQVANRTHLRGTLAAEQSPDGDGHRQTKVVPQDFLPVRMRAGDAIAFTRLTLHGSGPNTTNDPRVAYAIQFHHDDAMASWNGQEELVRLADNPRWSTAPVETIGSTEEKSRDGH